MEVFYNIGFIEWIAGKIETPSTVEARHHVYQYSLSVGAEGLGLIRSWRSYSIKGVPFYINYEPTICFGEGRNGGISLKVKLLFVPDTIHKMLELAELKPRGFSKDQHVVEDYLIFAHEFPALHKLFTSWGWKSISDTLEKVRIESNVLFILRDDSGFGEEQNTGKSSRAGHLRLVTPAPVASAAAAPSESEENKVTDSSGDVFRDLGIQNPIKQTYGAPSEDDGYDDADEEELSEEIDDDTKK